MKRLLLPMVLLSSAFSDDSFDRQEMPSRIVQKQIWPGRESWIARDNVRPDLDDLSMYGVEKFPRTLEPRVFAKPVTLSPATVIRRLNTGTRYMRNELSERIGPCDLECRVLNPIVIQPIEYNDLFDVEIRPSTGCTSKKCRRRSQGWELQEPLYVDEPHWIDIDKDFTNTLAERLDPNDPFVLSRGKKIIRLKDADYDDVAEIRENPRKFAIYRSLRSRRSLGPGKYDEKRNDREERDIKREERERKTTEARGRSTYFEDLRNLDQSADPFILTRGKKTRTQKYGDSATEYSDDYLDDENGRTSRMNRVARGKRSLETSSQEERSSEASDDSKNVKDSEVLKSNSISLPANASKIVPETDNPAILTNSKKASVKSSKVNFHGLSLSTKEKNIPRLNEVSNDPAQEDREFLLPNSRQKRSNRREAGSADESGMETNVPIEVKISGGYNQWLNPMRKSTADPSYVERRDKHADLMDLLEQPFFISRGKKKVELNDDSYLKGKQEKTEYNSLLKSLAIRNILDRLIDSLKCTSGECANDYNTIVKRKPPRDRRGALDELLAKYDPYYVARGKRTDNSSVNSRLEQNREAAFENKTLFNNMR